MFLIAVVAGGWASWQIYRSVFTWVLLLFIVVYLGAEYLWTWRRRGRSRR